jgi:hypothetical protein
MRRIGKKWCPFIFPPTDGLTAAGWQPDEHDDDGDDHQQLNQRECLGKTDRGCPKPCMDWPVRKALV